MSCAGSFAQNPGSKITGRPRLKLTKKERIRHSRDFKEIYRRGRRLKGPHLTIFFKPNRLGFNRLGLSVGKKRFKLSVRRHYIQRCLREAYRLNKGRFLPGYDIVISVQRFPPPASKASPAEAAKGPLANIAEELIALAQKTGVLDAKNIGK
jgi:ribonuclease P protein component